MYYFRNFRFSFDFDDIRFHVIIIIMQYIDAHAASHIDVNERVANIKSE